MSDPINAVYVDGLPVDKGAVRVHEATREILVLTSASEIQTMALPSRLLVALGRSIYAYASSSIAPHDGTTTLVSQDGRRYTRIVTLDNASSSEVAASLTSAGVPTEAVTFTAASRVLGSNGGGATVELTGSDLADLLDAALGDADWRDGAGSLSLSSRVDYLPANASFGMIGAEARLVMMGDGTIRVCGAGARAFNGDPGANNFGTTRVLGVPPATTVSPGKIYMGASAGYFVDSLGWPWSWGRNSYGALGRGDTTDRTAPARIKWFVTNNFKVSAIVPVMSGDDQDALGTYFLEDGGTGRVAYAGSHAYGASGDGTAAGGNKTTPVLATGLTGIVYLHACGNPTTVIARSSGGTWYGWGANDGTCLGITGTNFTSPQTITAMNGWLKAFVSGYNIIALTAAGGGVRVCGANSYGQLGQGNTTTLTGWQTPIGLAAGVVDLACNDGQAVTMAAITESTPGDRRLWTWGRNGAGQCGDGTTAVVTAPIQPSGLFQGDVEDVLVAGTGASDYAATYVRTTQRIWATGHNSQKNLCIGIAGNVSSFTEVRGFRGTILDWSVAGFSAYFGPIVTTDKGCWSGGHHDSGAAGVGPTLVNEAVMQPLWVPGIMGPQGAAGPPGIIAATLVGGSANLIDVSTDSAVTTGAAVRFTIATTNTASPVTVRFNGGSWLTVKTNDGSNPAIGYLTSGLQVVGFADFNLGTFRLITDPAAATLVSSASSATAAANSAAAAAAGAGGWHVVAEDQKTSGTHGGGSSAGSQTRTLNTLVRNTIGASLASNVLTVPAGTYEIEWDAPAQASNGHVSSLYNVTAGAVLATGTTEWSNYTGDNVVTRSSGRHHVTFAGSTQIRVDHSIGVARTTNGLGVAAAAGLVETYTRLRVRKLA